MSPPRLVWTPEMEAALRTLRKQGWSLYYCAEKIGVAYQTAVHKARELGIADRMRRPGRPGRRTAPEPASGWYAFSVTGDPEIDDRYCSATCFAAHQDGSCGCFADDEMTDLYVGGLQRKWTAIE